MFPGYFKEKYERHVYLVLCSWQLCESNEEGELTAA